MGRVVHFEIHASDPDRAERLYRRVFAWEISRSEGAPADYRLITTGADGEPGISPRRRIICSSPTTVPIRPWASCRASS
jgi:predicted enzyme related to lactoylglutathione lyase